MAEHRNKRVLFCGFWQAHHKVALTEHLEHFSYDHIGLISHENYLIKHNVDFIRQRSIYKHDTFLGNPASDLPSREIIEKMQAVETACLKMMDRNHKSPIIYRRYDFRKRTYLAQLASAYAILKHNRYDQILFSITPHNTFDYILHHLAQHLGIQSSFFAQIQVKDAFFHATEIEHIYTQILEHLNVREEDVDLPEHMETEISDRQGITKPFYMSAAGLTWKQQLYRKQKQIFRIHSYIQPLYAIPNWLAYQSIPKLQEPPQNDYVYFALHFQPEATTSPLGGIYVDQYFAILMLARSLPEGVDVIVKEHPRQHFWQRFPEFYKVLKEEPNVKFAHKTTDSLELTKNSLAVATITGTVGWEALFNEKPVFLFGTIFYENLKGVVKVTDQESISSAIKQIKAGSFEFASIIQIRQYLKAIDQAAYKGVMDEEYFRNSAFSKEHSIKVITNALNDILE